jgi:FAD/FMN-containing dehydrogenase
MPTEWANWSGSLRFTPATIEKPSSPEALAKLVGKARERGSVARMVGAGHSSSALVKTNDVLISLEKFQGLGDYDTDAREAWVHTGMSLSDTSKALQDIGLDMHNLGDVDVQTVAGAVATGTHGSGRMLTNLATMLIGVRMVNAEGELVEYNIEDTPDFFKGARVSLGALGIYTQIRLKLLPAYQLCRQTWCMDVDHLLPQLDALLDRNRNCDFYWYPRSDEVKLRTLNPPEKALSHVDGGKLLKTEQGLAGDIIPRTRTLKFEEMEYAIPAEAGPACFQAVRERVKALHRHYVGWRVLYRYIRQDDAYLSTANRQDVVTISLHQNNTLPFREYFNDIEPIFRAHGGRPHWAKIHNMTAEELRPLYPDWDAFAALRRQHDPDGVFASDYLRRLLGDVQTESQPRIAQETA